VTGYDHDRLNQTWREAHGWTERARDAARKLTTKRVDNRKPANFGKVNWDAYQHDQLYDMIMKSDPGAMFTRAGQWESLAAKIESTTGQVQQAMERVLGAWHGQAAVSSAESNSRLMRWAGDASQTAGKIAQGMATYTEAVERARKYMPEPAFSTAEHNFRNGYTVVGTGGPSTAILLKQLTSDGIVPFEEARARKAEAVQVMETYEAQSKDVHDTMPHFTDATPTTNDDVGAWTPPADTYDSGDSPGRHPGHGPVPGAGSGADVGVGSGGDSGTSAAGFVTPPAGSTTGGLGGGGLPGGSSFGGGLGSLGSGGSDLIRNSPGFGGGLVGVGGVPGRGGFGGALAGRGAAGVPGAFGGMPMGNAQGDEDKEHKNKYDEGMDFFDDLPPAYPPVFGA
jgi:PPE family